VKQHLVGKAKGGLPEEFQYLSMH